MNIRRRSLGWAVPLIAIAIMAASAVAASGAGAATQHWYSCVNAKPIAGQPGFKDSHCTEEVAGGSHSWRLIEPGLMRSITATNTTPFVLKSEGSIKYTITCSSLIGQTSVRNQSAPAGASIGEVLFQPGGCAVTQGLPTCVPTVSTINAPAVVEELAGQPALKLGSTVGRPDFQITFTSKPGASCPSAFTSSPTAVYGYWVATYNGPVLEFNPANSHLSDAGAVKVSGTFTTAITAGPEGVKLAP